MGCSDSQAGRDLVAATGADDPRITDHDEQVRGARHPDVQPLARAIPGLVLVDAEHHHATLEPLAAQDMAVEDVVGVPPGLPVAVLGVVGGPLDLDRVPLAGGQQRDVLGAPVLLEQSLRSEEHTSELQSLMRTSYA